MSWKIALVDGFTQAQKTWRAFQLLAEALENQKKNERILTLFITQANCTASAMQIIQRALADNQLSKLFGLVCRSNEREILKTGSVMFVDYWNTKNTVEMLKACTDRQWDRIIIVFDEADQGGYKGTKMRLDFVNRVEESVQQTTDLRLVFITATIANLSNSVYKASQDTDMKRGIVYNALYEPVVYNTTVHPHHNYFGPTDLEKFWKPIVFPKVDKGTTKDAVEAQKLDAICDAIGTHLCDERLRKPSCIVHP